MSSAAPAWAADYVGIPYRNKGRDRSGLDCWGLVRLVLAEQFGIKVPSYADRYASASEADEVTRLMGGEMGPWREIARDIACPGDLVLCRFLGEPCHVGVLAAPRLMLHVAIGVDTALVCLDSLCWARRVIGVYRHAV
jgi:cell wall-associated NlpC family hydrolase